MAFVSRKKPLSLERIAVLWADETGETSISAVVMPLVSAFAEGRVEGGRTFDSVVRTSNAWHTLSALVAALLEGPHGGLLTPLTLAQHVALGWTGYRRDPDHRRIRADWHGSSFVVVFERRVKAPLRRGFAQVFEFMMGDILRAEISRDSFLRWAEEEGYPRPTTFWDDEQTPPAPAVERTAPAATGASKQRLERTAREFDRVVQAMEADIDAGKTTAEMLRRNKKVHAATYGTGPTTAREAAIEVKRKREQSD